MKILLTGVRSISSERQQVLDDGVLVGQLHRFLQPIETLPWRFRLKARQLPEILCDPDHSILPWLVFFELHGVHLQLLNCFGEAAEEGV